MGTPIQSYTPVVLTYPYSDTDESPKSGEMQVLKNEAGVVEMVNFLCPCGCGRECPTHVVTMAEKADTSKQDVFKDSCWGFDEATLTISPSIRYTSACKSHFNVEGGKVKMHAN